MGLVSSHQVCWVQFEQWMGCTACPGVAPIPPNNSQALTMKLLHTCLDGYSRIIVPHYLSTDGTVNHNRRELKCEVPACSC